MEIILLPHRTSAKLSETGSYEASLPGSWSRGTRGSLIIHLILRQVFKIAPVTHSSEKGQRVSAAASGGSEMFSSQWDAGRAATSKPLLPGSGVWLLLISHSQKGMWKMEMLLLLWLPRSVLYPSIPSQGAWL